MHLLRHLTQETRDTMVEANFSRTLSDAMGNFFSRSRYALARSTGKNSHFLASPNWRPALLCSAANSICWPRPMRATHWLRRLTCAMATRLCPKNEHYCCQAAIADNIRLLKPAGL